MVSSCVHVNEKSGSIKGGRFLDKMNDCQFLKALFHGISTSVIISPLLTYNLF